MQKLNGIYTALVTPFTTTGKIDFVSLEKLLDIQMNAKVSGIVILGTTGENCTIDYYEKYKIIDFVQNKLNKHTKLIIGAGSNNTQQTINEIKGYSATNADAIMVSPPAYNKPSQNGLYNHFKKIADESYKPIILYNIPARTGVHLSIELINKLKDHPNIIGIKDASSDLEYAQKLIKLQDDKFSVLSGSDSLTLPLISIGYKGVVSVISNLIPNEMNYMIQKIQENDYRTARILMNYMHDITTCTMLESNPMPIKYMMSKLGLIKNKLRLPMTPLSSKHKKIIDQTMKNMELLGDNLCVE